MGCVDCSDTAGWRGSWRGGVGATEVYLDAHALELVMTNTDRLAQALRATAFVIAVYALFAGVYICTHY
jgi:hypothetical protein